MASSLYKFQVALKLCEDHDKKELHAYCKTCDKKICSSCIKGDHIQHDWEMISDILREKKPSLSEDCKEIRAKQLPRLRKEVDRFDRKMKKEDIALEHNKTVLNGYRKRYVDNINILFDDRIDKCHQKHDKATQIYKDKRDGLKQKVEYLDMMTTALNKDINTLPDHDILDMEKEMRDELEKALSYSADKYTCTTVFVPGQIDVQALESMVGEIHSVSVEEKNDIDRYNKCITSINPTSETNAWIKTLSDEYARLLKRTGQELKTIHTPCDYIVIMRRGEFVLGDEKNRKISVLTQEGNMIRTIDTTPLRPTCVRKTEDDDILVTLRDDGHQYNLVPSSRRIIQRMTLKEEVLHTYEFREDGKTRLFTWPLMATENKNTDICVINSLSSHNGELIVLQKDGRVKFTFKGDGLEFKKFLPLEIECDSKCCIIFTEGCNGAIHMLSAEGMYLCTLCQYEHLLPSVISIHGNDIWCGFLQGRVKVLKYISN